MVVIYDNLWKWWFWLVHIFKGPGLSQKINSPLAALFPWERHVRAKRIFLLTRQALNLGKPDSFCASCTRDAPVLALIGPQTSAILLLRELAIEWQPLPTWIQEEESQGLSEVQAKVATLARYLITQIVIWIPLHIHEFHFTDQWQRTSFLCAALSWCVFSGTACVLVH